MYEGEDPRYYGNALVGIVSYKLITYSDLPKDIQEFVYNKTFQEIYKIAHDFNHRRHFNPNGTLIPNGAIQMTNEDKLAAIQKLDGLWEITKDELLYEDPSKETIHASAKLRYQWYRLISDPSNPEYGLYRVVDMRRSANDTLQAGATITINSAFSNEFKSSCCLVAMVYDSNLGLFKVTKVDVDDTTIEQFTYKGGSQIYGMDFETGNDGKQQTNAVVAYESHKKLSDEETKKIVGNETAEKAYRVTWEKNHSDLVKNKK